MEERKWSWSRTYGFELKYMDLRIDTRDNHVSVSCLRHGERIELMSPTEMDNYFKEVEAEAGSPSNSFLKFGVGSYDPLEYRKKYLPDPRIEKLENMKKTLEMFQEQSKEIPVGRVIEFIDEVLK